jgi:hypothetical protein
MSVFPPDYFAARDRFRSAAGRLGCAVESQAIESRGPAGEELTIDVARSGTERAEYVVVISSGLHGVEGIFGSAVQTALLDMSATGGVVLPPGTALVLIHALNPWGFAHLRRTDQGNIDLNRNFLLPGEQYSGSADLYQKLDPILNPSRPPGRVDLFAVRALAAIARHGRAAVTQAIAQGQYAFPRGLFFGGNGESEVARVLCDHLPRWVGTAARVLHLDLHTGLGPWATYKLIADFQLSGEEREMAPSNGGALIEPRESPRGFYRSRGGLGGWCRATFQDRRYLLLVAEFGTYRPLKVLSALRKENQAHHFCHPDDPRRIVATQRLVEVFCPESERWRDACVGQAIAMVLSGITRVRGYGRGGH